MSSSVSPIRTKRRQQRLAALLPPHAKPGFSVLAKATSESAFISESNESSKVLDREIYEEARAAASVIVDRNKRLADILRIAIMAVRAARAETRECMQASFAMQANSTRSS